MTEDESRIEKFRETVLGSRNVVFFGGAGVSTESGLPDFRGAKGIYRKDNAVDAETALSSRWFFDHTAEFYDFYRHNLLYPDAEPNVCHRALAELERRGIVRAVITQNVDGLHQKAGSCRVIELHGSALRNRCLDCGKLWGIEAVSETEGIPRCRDCGGLIKPEVTLYGEQLDDGAISDAVRYISSADVLIIGGTSLSVYPAASFIGYFSGSAMIIINATPTPADGLADMVFGGSIGAVMSRLLD